MVYNDDEDWRRNPLKKHVCLLLVLVLLCLTGCQSIPGVDTRMQVALAENPNCTVTNNGQWVIPGSDAVFFLEPAPGWSLAETDYQGEYSLRLRDGRLELTLKNVTYPGKYKLTMTQKFATLTYMPNGADAQPVQIPYDLTNHLRPNTATDFEGFAREGYSLVSWNTEPDGSGIRVGLGSRVTAEGELTLYAQWEKWADASDFTYGRSPYNTVYIRKYTGNAEKLVIPERIEGMPVTDIYGGAFEGAGVCHLILPGTMRNVAPGAFAGCENLQTLTVFDSLHSITDDAFSGCDKLKTLYINAMEAPWGYAYRKESVYADKVDLLLAARGQKKLIFYGGCSAWYNLDGKMAQQALGESYTLVNMGLNGTVNSYAQMQILEHLLEPGDVLVHTLELTSQVQLLLDTVMARRDDKLWCGLEYNYDLFSLVDLRTVPGALDSLSHYLDQKDREGEKTYYGDDYRDAQGRRYLDEFGGIPFAREETSPVLTDRVELDPANVNHGDLALLEGYYDGLRDLGVRVYVSYACVNMDQVPQDQKENVPLMDSLIRNAIGQMESARLISRLSDYLYGHDDFYDTNYHLLSSRVEENTALWLRDLITQMKADGLIP